MNRRKFIKNTLLSSFALGLGTALYAYKIEPFRLEFVNQKMPIKNLPEHLHGKILMQISDIHVGTRFDYNYIIDSFIKAKKINPDFVVYTGDYISYKNKEQLEQLQIVMEHSVKGKMGTAGILGNHDYGKNWAEEKVATAICAILQNAGIDMLRNEQKEYNGLNIIGLDDFWGLNFAPEKIMPYHNPSKANIVLCHNPDVCDLNVWDNYTGWILSGHTHGGQCKPPFLPPPMLPVKNKKYTAGKFILDDGRMLYINRALGSLWQVRFNVRPEITVFELQKA